MGLYFLPLSLWIILPAPHGAATDLCPWWCNTHFSDFLHCVIPMILVCKLRNNTITSPVVILSGTFKYCFWVGEDDLLFLKMLYNLVFFLSLHVKLVLVTTVGAVMIYEVTANNTLANTETLSMEKMKGAVPVSLWWPTCDTEKVCKCCKKNGAGWTRGCHRPWICETWYLWRAVKWRAIKRGMPVY